MFTRNFYDHQEVIASLHWCMKRGRVKEAVFWCLELLESELHEVVINELFTVWLWHFGLGNLSAFPLLQTLDSKEQILAFVCGLTSLPKETRDRSVLTLLLFGSIDEIEPDRTSAFPCLEPLFQELHCSLIEQAFARAVYQGKSRLAFDLSRPLWQENPSRVFDLLQRIQTLKHNNQSLAECLTLFEFQITEHTWATRACAIASVCLHSKLLKRSLQPFSCSISSHIQEALIEWENLSGRTRRIFQIPSESLYMRTERGRMSNRETNLKLLYTLSEKTLEGCPFWNRILEEEAPWLDDDRKEAFYDTYFPDDIPDEWSRIDQEKSHGYGVLINNEQPNPSKYRTRWFQGISSRAYWVTNALEKIGEWESRLTTTEWIQTVSAWCLTPVKKRVFVVEEDCRVLQLALLPQEEKQGKFLQL